MVDARQGDEPGIVLRHADPRHRLTGVRLAPEIVLDGDLAFRPVPAGWRLVLPPTRALRIEYRLELRHPDGRTELVCDPANPMRAGGAYGDRSVLELPGYRAPAWLTAPVAPGTWRELELPSGAIRSTIAARVWSPVRRARGILVAHDGPEYDQRARLGRFTAAMIAARELPPCHLVLLAPGDRNEWYSANPSYTRALAGEALPRLRLELGPAPVVGVGVSLGALALLAAQRRHPAAFAGLFLQSGSFFLRRYDSQESRFRRYRRIVRFVGEVERAPAGSHPVPVAITCGLVEENLANNREMAATLRRLGHPVTLHEVPDGHNFTAWRDALYPGLVGLLRAACPVPVPHA